MARRLDYIFVGDGFLPLVSKAEIQSEDVLVTTEQFCAYSFFFKREQGFQYLYIAFEWRSSQHFMCEE